MVYKISSNQFRISTNDNLSLIKHEIGHTKNGSEFYGGNFKVDQSMIQV